LTGPTLADVVLEYDAPAALLLRQAIEGLANGDQQALCGRVLRPNLRWHEPGRNLVAGDYSGCQEVVGHLFARFAELSGGTFRVEVTGVAASDSQAIGVYTTHAQRRGLTLASHDVCVADLADGSIASARIYHSDQHAWDRFWA